MATRFSGGWIHWATLCPIKCNDPRQILGSQARLRSLRLPANGIAFCPQSKVLCSRSKTRDPRQFDAKNGVEHRSPKDMNSWGVTSTLASSLCLA